LQDTAFFAEFGSYLWKNRSDLRENFARDVHWTTRKIPLKFGSYPYPNWDFTFEFGKLYGSALAVVRALQVLLVLMPTNW